MIPRAIDGIKLGPNGNLQGIIRGFSLDIDRKLQTQLKEVVMHKMSISEISRTDCTCEQQKAILT